MSEETQNTAVEEAVKNPQVSQDEKKTEQAVPYYRFQELVKERNDLKSKVRIQKLFHCLLLQKVAQQYFQKSF